MFEHDLFSDLKGEDQHADYLGRYANIPLPLPPPPPPLNPFPPSPLSLPVRCIPSLPVRCTPSLPVRCAFSLPVWCALSLPVWCIPSLPVRVLFPYRYGVPLPYPYGAPLPYPYGVRQALECLLPHQVPLRHRLMQLAHLAVAAVGQTCGQEQGGVTWARPAVGAGARRGHMGRIYKCMH